MKFSDLSPRPGPDWEPTRLAQELRRLFLRWESETPKQVSSETETTLRDLRYPVGQLASGVEDASGVTLRWDNSNRQVVFVVGIEAWWVWIQGKRLIPWPPFPGPDPPDPPEGDPEPKLVIADTEGFHVVYLELDEDGELSVEEQVNPTSAQMQTILEECCPLAGVYWNGSDGRLSDQRFSSRMAVGTRLMELRTTGLRLEEGVVPGDFSLDGDGSSDAHAQFSLTAGSVFAADLRLPVNALEI